MTKFQLDICFRQRKYFFEVVDYCFLNQRPVFFGTYIQLQGVYNFMRSYISRYILKIGGFNPIGETNRHLESLAPIFGDEKPIATTPPRHCYGRLRAYF